MINLIHQLFDEIRQSWTKHILKPKQTIKKRKPKVKKKIKQKENDYGLPWSNNE